MTAHLREVAEHGEAVAALWASESSIYGRFGYGAASSAVELKISTRNPVFHRLAPEPAPVRLLTIEEAKEAVPPINRQVAAAYPAMFERHERWWEARWFADLPADRHGATALRAAVSELGDGYVLYRQKFAWQDGNPAGKLIVTDLQALSPESWAGLWRFVLNHDLITTVEADLRSPEEPLLDLLAAPRQALARTGDGVWVRLVDPPAALAARRYSAPGELVIEAHDPLDGSTHTLLLTASADGATCTRTDRAPDVVLDLEDLGSVYLGRSRLRQLARIGRVSGDHRALALADIMFHWDPQPWCPEIF